MFPFELSLPHDLRDPSELDGTVLPSSCGPYQNPQSNLSPCTTSGTCNTRSAVCGNAKYVSPFSAQAASEQEKFREKIRPAVRQQVRGEVLVDQCGNVNEYLSRECHQRYRGVASRAYLVHSQFLGPGIRVFGGFGLDQEIS